MSHSTDLKAIDARLSLASSRFEDDPVLRRVETALSTSGSEIADIVRAGAGIGADTGGQIMGMLANLMVNGPRPAPVTMKTDGPSSAGAAIGAGVAGLAAGAGIAGAMAKGTSGAKAPATGTASPSSGGTTAASSAGTSATGGGKASAAPQEVLIEMDPKEYEKLCKSGKDPLQAFTAYPVSGMSAEEAQKKGLAKIKGPDGKEYYVSPEYKKTYDSWSGKYKSSVIAVPPAEPKAPAMTPPPGGTATVPEPPAKAQVGKAAPKPVASPAPKPAAPVKQPVVTAASKPSAPTAIPPATVPPAPVVSAPAAKPTPPPPPPAAAPVPPLFGIPSAKDSPVVPSGAPSFSFKF